MAWYWITLIVLGYLIVGIALAIILKKIKAVNDLLGLDYPAPLCGTAVLWPIFLVFSILYFLLSAFGLFIQWLSEKF